MLFRARALSTHLNKVFDFYFLLAIVGSGVFEMNTEKTVEQGTCLDVMNLHKWKAISLIRDRGLVDHIIEEERQKYPHSDPCYISHRINLKIRRGHVISATIG